MSLPLKEKLGLTVKETATLLSVSDKTVRRLIGERRLFAIRIGKRRFLVPRDAVERFLQGEPGGQAGPERW